MSCIVLPEVVGMLTKLCLCDVVIDCDVAYFYRIREAQGGNLK